MKVRASIRQMCGDCKIVSRTKRNKKCLFVICKKNPRHKQRQG